MLNASVLEHQDLNASLQHQLEETRGRELEEADIAARLHGAEDEIAQLKGTLVELSRKAQVRHPTEVMKMKKNTKKGHASLREGVLP